MALGFCSTCRHWRRIATPGKPRGQCGVHSGSSDPDKWPDEITARSAMVVHLNISGFQRTLTAPDFGCALCESPVP